MKLTVVPASPGGYPQPNAHLIKTTPTPWTTLYRAGGAAALAVLALIPVQGVVFMVNPPPSTVVEYFALFQQSPLRGLLALDLLLMVDYGLLILVYLALFATLRRYNPSLMAIGTTLALAGMAIYFASSVAFEMLSLSARFAEATTVEQRSVLLAAGETMLVTYTGTAYLASYFLGAVAVLVFSVVMLQCAIFSRWTAYAGLLMGVLSLVPSTAGAVGLAFSFLSLLPTAVWLGLVGSRLVQLGGDPSSVAAD
jgi:hypothetical protein